jgi:hypothetical protein
MSKSYQDLVTEKCQSIYDVIKPGLDKIALHMAQHVVDDPRLAGVKVDMGEFDFVYPSLEEAQAYVAAEESD